MNVPILKINPLEPEEKAITKAAEILSHGGLVVFPTETLYGIAADAFNPSAVEKIFQVKKRPKNKPLIILIENLNQLKIVARDIPKAAYVLAKKFWPGPLTLILKKKEIIPKSVSGGGNTVAVRISSHPVARALVKALGKPITAPSANISGLLPHRIAKGVIRQLGQKKEIKLILDAGKTPFGKPGSENSTAARPGRKRLKVEFLLPGKPSTILDLTKKPFKILRQGSIKDQEIKKVL